MLYDLKVDEYLKRNPLAQKVAEITKPHRLVKGDCPIVVYYESIIGSSNNRSIFALFNNGQFVGNSIMFFCEVPHEDRYAIGKDMIDELLSNSDFRDFDKELQGMAACTEFEKTYKTCDECHLYAINECYGAVYSIPHHKNIWEVQKKWDEKYGDGSPGHIKYVTSKMIGHLNSYMWVCGNDEASLKEFLEYAKSHPNNKHEDMFK